MPLLSMTIVDDDFKAKNDGVVRFINYVGSLYSIALTAELGAMLSVLSLSFKQFDIIE